MIAALPIIMTTFFMSNVSFTCSIVLLIEKYAFFVVNVNKVWVATFLEAGVNKVIPCLSNLEISKS